MLKKSTGMKKDAPSSSSKSAHAAPHTYGGAGIRKGAIVQGLNSIDPPAVNIIVKLLRCLGGVGGVGEWEARKERERASLVR